MHSRTETGNSGIPVERGVCRGKTYVQHAVGFLSSSRGRTGRGRRTGAVGRAPTRACGDGAAGCGRWDVVLRWGGWTRHKRTPRLASAARVRCMALLRDVRAGGPPTIWTAGPAVPAGRLASPILISASCAPCIPMYVARITCGLDPGAHSSSCRAFD
jgi:hypothetical protein